MFFVMAYAPAETGGECWMQSKRSLMFDLALLKQGVFFNFFVEAVHKIKHLYSFPII